MMGKCANGTGTGASTGTATRISMMISKIMHVSFDAEKTKVK